MDEDRMKRGRGARRAARLLARAQPRLTARGLTARLLVPLAQPLVLAALAEQRVDDLERRLRELL